VWFVALSSIRPPCAIIKHQDIITKYSYLVEAKFHYGSSRTNSRAGSRAGLRPASELLAS